MSRRNEYEIYFDEVDRGNLAGGGDVHEPLSFLLGWGGKVEVLSPDVVRERVQEELAAAAARYR